MGTYKGIQGYMVESLASDPGDISKVLGKLWYNSGSNVWKLGTEAAGSWSTGGSLTTGRNQEVTTGVSSDAALCINGRSSTANPFPGVETYDGTAWTEVTDTSTARRTAAGAGTSTATWFAGGFTGVSPSTTSTSVAEEWNGTGWSEMTALPTARGSASGMGTTTSGLIVGGAPIPSGVDSWNGTAWSEETDLVSSGDDGQGDGASNTAAFYVGGSPGPNSALNQQWNGTGWTQATGMTNNRVSGSAAGTTTAGLVFGGYDSGYGTPTNTPNVEEWNGTGWTEVANIATVRTNTSGDGSTTSAILAGGYDGSYLTATEEWSSGPKAATVTTS